MAAINPGRPVPPPNYDDVARGLRETAAKNDERYAHECEDAQVIRALNHRSENYGCTIIVVSFFALLAWVAYLVFQFPPAQ